MTKLFVGPHQASELRTNGLWDPEKMTTDRPEAAASTSASMKQPFDVGLTREGSAPMKPPLPNNIVVSAEAAQRSRQESNDPLRTNRSAKVNGNSNTVA